MAAARRSPLPVSTRRMRKRPYASLDRALSYVQRLGKAPNVRYPMLGSHELRTEDKDHPVRFQVSADWSDAT